MGLMIINMNGKRVGKDAYSDDRGTYALYRFDTLIV